MLDKIKIILDNTYVSDENRRGYKQYKGIRNPNKIVNVKYIPLDKNKHDAFFENNVDEEEDLQSVKEIEKHRIKVILIDDTNKHTTKLIVEGSIRKWYFGIDATQDLKRNEFIHCIDSISRIIGLEDKSLWNAKITQLETGVTIRMKDEHRGIVNCIFDYQAFQKNTFGQYGVEFKGANYDVIFYDQIRKIYNHRDKKERQYKKLTNNNFFLRYEIQGHKVSGMDMFKDKLDTLLKVRSNWKYIAENLLLTLDEVTFVNTISPDLYVELKKGGKKEMSRFLTYKGLQEIGLENFRILLEQMKSRKKSAFKKDFVELYNDFSEKDKKDYKKIFSRKLEQKLNFLLK